MGKQTTRTTCSKPRIPKNNITRKDVLSTKDNNDQKDKCGCGKEINEFTYHIQNSKNSNITINNFFIRAEDASGKVNTVIEPIKLSGQSATKVQPVVPKSPKTEVLRLIIKFIILIISPLLITLAKRYLEWFPATHKTLTPEQMLLIEEKFLDFTLEYGIWIFGSKKLILIIIFMIVMMILTRS